MFEKQFRFNLVQLVFNFIFRFENDLDHNLEDILLLNTDSTEKVILEDVIKDYPDSRKVIEPHLLDYGWGRTPFLSRAILVTFLEEIKHIESDSQAKVIAEYLHLTQDLSGAESVALVHAVIGKIAASSKKDEGTVENNKI